MPLDAVANDRPPKKSGSDPDGGCAGPKVSATPTATKIAKRARKPAVPDSAFWLHSASDDAFIPLRRGGYLRFRNRANAKKPTPAAISASVPGSGTEMAITQSGGQPSTPPKANCVLINKPQASKAIRRRAFDMVCLSPKLNLGIVKQEIHHQKQRNDSNRILIPCSGDCKRNRRGIEKSPALDGA